MIKLFRHIRQKLVSENKFSKYLLYAIGEIVLVVIGILIALQINNWNEDRKLTKTQTTYLKQLYEDISFMEKGYDKRLMKIKNRVELAHKALVFLETCDLGNENKIYLDSLLLTHQGLSGFYNVHDTYDEMLSANVLASLKNQELKESITDLYTVLDFSNSFIPYFRSDLGRASQIIWEHVSFGYDASRNQTVRYDIKQICNNSVFKNALVEVIDSNEDILGDYESLFLKISRTKDALAKELQL